MLSSLTAGAVWSRGGHALAQTEARQFATVLETLSNK